MNITQVQNMRGNDDDSQNPGGKYTSFCSSNSQKPLLLNDKRYTYLSNSNDVRFECCFKTLSKNFRNAGCPKHDSLPFLLIFYINMVKLQRVNIITI